MLQISKYISNTLTVFATLLLFYASASNATTSNDSTRSVSHSSNHRSSAHHNAKTHAKTTHPQHKNTQHLAHNNQVKRAQNHKSHATKRPHSKPVHANKKLHTPHITHHQLHNSHAQTNVHHLSANTHNKLQAKSNQNRHTAIVRHQPNNLNNPSVAAIHSGPVNNNSLTFNSMPANQTAGMRLVSFVHEMVGSLRYTRYASGAGVFDSKYGIYKLDCSHYVDNILHRVDPRAYASLEAGTGAQMPNSANYYNFFTRLSDHLRYDWDKVDNAKDLEPGDVLVFRYKSPSGIQEGGHVMMVMDKPVIDNGALFVRVTDSAAAGHSDDTRPAHDSGVGIGTLVLKVNSYTGQPSAYAWEFNSPWKSVDIAMARPPSSMG